GQGPGRSQGETRRQGEGVTMSDKVKPADGGQAWAPYVPDEKAPWNLRRVVHLHRRAGVAAAWGGVPRDPEDGPQGSIDRVLAGKAATAGVPEGFAETARFLADAARDLERLKAWWVYRMLFGPDPLTERLTLLWHNHFATSADKVHSRGLMRRQNELLRELARAPFGRLLDRAVRDPALLLWLDAPANRKGHPNENLGRELMELFTLGIGHYSETDVKEAARALTGWTGEQEQFTENAALHDAEEKTILGRTGRWKGDDLLRLLVEHPATARRLAFRLCELLLGENVAAAGALEALAAGLRDHDLDVGGAVETILRSETFFADGHLGNRLPRPADHLAP